MEKIEKANTQSVNWDKIGTWVAIIGAFFMYWQSMRDIHKDILNICERLTRIEVKVDSLEKRIDQLGER